MAMRGHIWDHEHPPEMEKKTVMLTARAPGEQFRRAASGSHQTESPWSSKNNWWAHQTTVRREGPTLPGGPTPRGTSLVYVRPRDRLLHVAVHTAAPSPPARNRRRRRTTQSQAKVSNDYNTKKKRKRKLVFSVESPMRTQTNLDEFII